MAVTPAGVTPMERSRPIRRRSASTRPPIAVASVKPVASSASSVAVPRIASVRRDSSVNSLRVSSQLSTRSSPSAASRSATAVAASGSRSRSPAVTTTGATGAPSSGGAGVSDPT